MKTIFLVVMLAGLASCQALKRSGDIVCDAHHVAADSISDAGEYLGGPGNLVADILNATLEIGCRIFKATVAIPADVADGPGAPEVVDGKEPAHTE